MLKSWARKSWKSINSDNPTWVLNPFAPLRSLLLQSTGIPHVASDQCLLSPGRESNPLSLSLKGSAAQEHICTHFFLLLLLESEKSPPVETPITSYFPEGRQKPDIGMPGSIWFGDFHEFIFMKRSLVSQRKAQEALCVNSVRSSDSNC